MNDQIESATETLSLDGIVLGKTATTIVTSLAVYGALSLTRDVTGFAKKVYNKRKATREAAEKADPTPANEQ